MLCPFTSFSSFPFPSPPPFSRPQVNDLFYTQGLATNLGYSGTDKKKVKDITKEDFDDSACTDWGERRLTRMR